MCHLQPWWESSSRQACPSLLHAESQCFPPGILQAILFPLDFFCALNLSPGGTRSTVYPRVVRLRPSGTQTAPKSCPPLPRVSFHIIPLALPHLTFLLPTGRLAGSFTRQPCGLIDSLPLLTAGEVLDVPTGERINHRGLTRCFEVEGTGGRAFPRSAASPIAWEGQKSTECVQPKGCLWQLLPAARLGARGCSEMELCCGTAGRRLPAFPVLLQQKAEWQRGGKKGVATSP